MSELERGQKHLPHGAVFSDNFLFPIFEDGYLGKLVPVFFRNGPRMLQLLPDKIELRQVAFVYNHHRNLGVLIENRCSGHQEHLAGLYHVLNDADLPSCIQDLQGHRVVEKIFCHYLGDEFPHDMRCHDSVELLGSAVYRDHPGLPVTNPDAVRRRLENRFELPVDIPVGFQFSHRELGSSDAADCRFPAVVPGEQIDIDGKVPFPFRNTIIAKRVPASQALRYQAADLGQDPGYLHPGDGSGPQTGETRDGGISIDHHPGGIDCQNTQSHAVQYFFEVHSAVHYLSPMFRIPIRTFLPQGLYPASWTHEHSTLIFAHKP